MPRRTKNSNKQSENETEGNEQGQIQIQNDPELVTENNHEQDVENQEQEIADAEPESEPLDVSASVGDGFEFAFDNQEINDNNPTDSRVEHNFADRVFSEIEKLSRRIEELNLGYNSLIIDMNHRMQTMEYEQKHIYKILREDHLAAGVVDKRIAILEKTANNLNQHILENNNTIDDVQQIVENEKVTLTEKINNNTAILGNILTAISKQENELEEIKRKNNELNPHVMFNSRFREEKIYLREFNEGDENPCLWLDDIRKLMTLRPELDRWERLYPVLDKALKKVDAWWNSVKGLIGNYEEFKERFKLKYFNKTIQRNFMIKLRTGKYNAKQGSMSSYFIKNVSIARNLDLKPPDEELVQMIIAHYPLAIRETIVLHKIKEINEVEKLLQEMDDLGIKTEEKTLRYEKDPNRKYEFAYENNYEKKPRRISFNIMSEQEQGYKEDKREFKVKSRPYIKRWNDGKQNGVYRNYKFNRGEIKDAKFEQGKNVKN